MSDKGTREIGIRGEAEAYKTLDRNLIYLSAGSIVVSLFILKALIIELQFLQYVALIFIADALFCLALLSSVWSFFSSAKAFRKYYTGEGERREERKKVSHSFGWKTTNVLNWLSTVSFTIGLLTLLIFVGLNILSINDCKVEKDLGRKSGAVKIGAVLPPEDQRMDELRMCSARTNRQTLTKILSQRRKK